mgnify:CR=1 FL=1
MSSRFCASIRIGGQIERSKVEPLLKELREAALSLEWGDAPFLPQNADELMAGRKDKHLWLCDEQADYGEFPELEAACRKLGLAYCRHSEASFDCDAELADWRPGMKEPLVRTGSNINSHDSYVPIEAVRKAAALLEAGQPDSALHALRRLCLDIPALPPLEIV